MINNKRTKKYLGTAFQKKILFLVFASSLIPASIVAVCMYYLIFNTLALEMVIPEAIAYNLMPVIRKVNTIIAVAVPISLVVIWLVALELSHRIAGPLYRMEKELDEIIQGGKRCSIKLRRNDECKLFIDKLNRVITK